MFIKFINYCLIFNRGIQQFVYILLMLIAFLLKS